MANPKLSETMRRNIERDIRIGLCDADSQKKRKVSNGTISNVRHDQLAMDIEATKLRRKQKEQI